MDFKCTWGLHVILWAAARHKANFEPQLLAKQANMGLRTTAVTSVFSFSFWNCRRLNSLGIESRCEWPRGTAACRSGLSCLYLACL